MKFNNSGIFQSLKLGILVEKIFPISLKLNFTPITSGCYGLINININCLKKLIYPCRKVITEKLSAVKSLLKNPVRSTFSLKILGLES